MNWKFLLLMFVILIVLSASSYIALEDPSNPRFIDSIPVLNKLALNTLQTIAIPIIILAIIILAIVLYLSKKTMEKNIRRSPMDPVKVRVHAGRIVYGDYQEPNSEDFVFSKGSF